MEQQFKIPTETVELPSKGLIYPENSPLSKGTVEMKYMTAKEEDILTNGNYIKNGTVIDRLLKSLIVTEGVDYKSLLLGDKNAIMVAARILAYGAAYDITYNGEKITVDLSKVDNLPIDEKLYKRGENEFKFELPSKNEVTFKLLTEGDESAIDREMEGLKKLNKSSSTTVTTRLKRMITSVNGNREVGTIRKFVDNYLLATDARALRKEYERVMPDVDLVFEYTNDDGGKEDVDIPIGLGFFWPDNRL